MAKLNEKRQELARPVLNDFLEYLKTINPTPKTGFGKAVHYTLDQLKYLERYLIDGRLEISNNRAERSLKPLVIYRKNFLFANTARRARASAVMLSIIQPAKEIGFKSVCLSEIHLQKCSQLGYPIQC
ncbi:MAG TPA: transposase [Ruminiclostridium sp.]|nr:transposase [Ruminiclostridium sp.]